MNKMRFTIFLLIFLGFTLPAFGISPIISWMMDMYNQPSIKPQEGGNVQSYPLGSVTVDGLVVNSDNVTDTQTENFGTWFAYRNDSAIAPKNPTADTELSRNNGKYLYNVYCAACHGEDANGGTPVGNLRGVPGIAPILQYDETITDGYLYSKIKYGGAVLASMPPLGYATTEKERWDIVNYITSEWGVSKNGN